MSFADLRNEQIRRIILDTLRQDANYTVNEAILRAILRDFGFAVSQDLLRTELAWLIEQSLIITWDQGGIVIAKIRSRGVDVSSGCTIIPGVARPEPEAN